MNESMYYTLHTLHYSYTAYSQHTYRQSGPAAMIAEGGAMKQPAMTTRGDTMVWTREGVESQIEYVCIGCFLSFS